MCPPPPVPTRPRGSRRWDCCSARVGGSNAGTTTPGCAVAISLEGALDYARGYGMSNLEYDVPITPDSIFHVASLSKQFTAFSVRLLAQEGKLSLKMLRAIPGMARSLHSPSLTPRAFRVSSSGVAGHATRALRPRCP
ncbi:serine hydrolase [Archangium gephyra]|nr:serine hydrolase [Archangium gephyra]